MNIRFEPIRLVSVEMKLGGVLRPVGRLAWVERRILFEYDETFPRRKLDISPFKLREAPPSKIIPAPAQPFEGLHGVFDDSLPDGWGRLLMDRKLAAIGIHPTQLTPLDRLAWVGTRGMGALQYRPGHPQLFPGRDGPIDLDHLAAKSRQVLNDSPKAVLDELLRAGGTPGGARPKALVCLSPDGARLVHGMDDVPDGYSDWIVKFRAREEGIDAGAIEYAYSLMARVAGVDMPDTMLFPARKGPGHFGARRFDRDRQRRIHMHTAAGLLHASHRMPSLDYGELLKATRALTRQQGQVERMFARMVFNVFSQNRDDHTKNHGFLMDENGTWQVSPAYDLTHNAGMGGEHALAVAGEARTPGVKHILVVAKAVGVPDATAKRLIDQVKDAVDRWPRIASDAGVAKASIKALDLRLNGARAGKRP